jgi:hypothetical protein
MPDGPPPRPPAPPWLSKAALAAAKAAGRPPGAVPRLGDADSRAVREAILAHRPALPLSVIAEAVAYVLGEE